jgi:Arc/MetJ-type ribon-helix-helix transcriptional regulator
MTVNLTSRQIAWLEKQVAKGAFGSIEEAAQFYLDQRMDGEHLDLDPNEVRPLLEEAERDIADGRIESGEDVKAKLKARIRSLEG